MDDGFKVAEETSLLRRGIETLDSHSKKKKCSRSSFHHRAFQLGHHEPSQAVSNVPSTGRNEDHIEVKSGGPRKEPGNVSGLIDSTSMALTLHVNRSTGR